MFPSFLKRKSVIILAAAGFLVSIIFMVYGFAPVISVNGERASLSEFLKVQSAITNMDKNANNGVLKLSDDAIKERVFGNIIDKILMDALITRTDTSLDKKAEELVKQAIGQNPTLQLDEAAKTLYGLSAGDFIELVLLPQAKRDLLNERFKDNPTQLNETWESLIKTADIKIYYPGYKWEDGEIKKK